MPIATQTPVLAVETADDFKQRTHEVLSVQDKGILLSSSLNLKPLAEPSGLTRTPITWPIQDLNMFYLLDAPPCTDVPQHAHQSDIFRLVIEGELVINGTEVKAGTWMVVPKGTLYSITSKTGYKALVAYKDLCEVTGGYRQLTD
jgi:hypothetical protein